MINPQWLELPMSRTNFHGPKDVRAIEVRPYMLIVVPMLCLMVSVCHCSHLIEEAGNLTFLAGMCAVCCCMFASFLMSLTGYVL